MLNQKERDELGVYLGKLTTFYDAAGFDRTKITLYIDTLEEFYGMGLDDYKRALSSYQKDFKKRTFPTPAALREFLFPELDPTDEANEVASMVFEAIERYGWANPSAAEKFLGPIGWSIVLSHGGWMSICENLGVTIPESVFRAQARDLALSRINSDRRGIDRHWTALEHKNSNHVSSMISHITKGIPE